MYCLDKTPTIVSKEFRVWIPASGKIEVTRNLKFFEGIFLKSKTPFEEFADENMCNDLQVNHKEENINVYIELTSGHQEINAKLRP